MAEYLGVNQINFPAVRILDPIKELKYYYEGAINNKTTFKSFDMYIKDFLKGNIAPTFKTDPLPKVQANTYTIVVGKTFKEIVLNVINDVFVFFVSPFCEPCKDFENDFEKIATLLKDCPNLVFAKMDGVKNEYEGLILESFPSLILFTQTNNKRFVFEHEGKPSIQ